MFNFRQSKKGFTTVELVIVIVVIAVLAGVLIPTFSSVISKANLTSDMKAVRDMNEELKANAILNGVPANVEDVARILGAAGYYSEAWAPLSKDCEVRWFATTNEVVLIQTNSDGIQSVIYPKDFSYDIYTPEVAVALKTFNAYKSEALRQNMGLTSGGTTKGNQDIISGSGNGALPTITSGETADNLGLGDLVSSSNKNLPSEVKSALNGGIALAANKKTSVDAAGKSYVSMDIISTKDSYNKQAEGGNLKSIDDIKADVYYISTTVDANATPEQKAEVAVAAGKYVYTLFEQMNNDQVSKEANIAIAPGTTIKVCDEQEQWAVPKLFSGYFGSADASKPITIDGLVLTKNTGFLNTYTFPGTGSVYYMTGFFGAIYGNTTIENVVFKNVKIEEPAVNSKVKDSIGTASEKGNSSCTAIIGGVVPTEDEVAANVVLRNIVVDSSCKIVGGGRTGGLLAYIGGGAANNETGSVSMKGKVTIDNCTVSCTVETTNQSIKQGNYATCGGIVGGISKAYNYLADGKTADPTQLQVEIKNSKFDGAYVKGGHVGGIIAYSQTQSTITITDCVVAPTTVLADVEGVTRPTGQGAVIGRIAGAASSDKNIVWIFNFSEEAYNASALNGATIFCGVGGLTNDLKANALLDVTFESGKTVKTTDNHITVNFK